MRRLLQWIAIAALVAAALALGVRPDGGSLAGSADVAQIAAGLRCPVCQGLSVRDSDSPAARSIRDDIAQRLEAGETPAEVRAAYVERYGEWILLRPGSSGLAGLAWAIPTAGAAAGAVALGAALYGWRRRRDAVPTVAQQELVTGARTARAVARPADVEP